MRIEDEEEGGLRMNDTREKVVEKVVEKVFDTSDVRFPAPDLNRPRIILFFLL